MRLSPFWTSKGVDGGDEEGDLLVSVVVIEGRVVKLEIASDLQSKRRLW